MIKDEVKKTFKIFEYTPFSERMEDIHKQFFNLIRFKDLNNLKESVGNLSASLIQLCNESGWDFENVIKETLMKIESRKLQYKSLGRKKRIAIYGGAFNPIHNAHIKVAQIILTAAKMDEVWLVPAYKHMNNKNLLKSEHRINMLNLAVKDFPNIKVFKYEIDNKLGGETYKFLKKLLSDDKYANFDFFYVLGQDNANNFKEWYNFEHLQNLIPFIIIPRKGVIPKDNWYKKSPHIYLNKETDIMELSSTTIRNIIFKNVSDVKLKNILNKDVLKYIKQNNLYERCG